MHQTIQAPASAVYTALTMPTLLQLWLCDQAQGTFTEKGMFFYRWNAGFYATGTFKTLQKDKQIVQTWRFSTEPTESTLTVSLTDADGGTLVNLDYSGSDSTLDWTAALENLKYVLEVGHDLRIMNRPMLGIHPSQLEEPRAAQLGIPGVKGTHIDGVLEGMGAAKVLQTGDVIVMVDGKPVTDYVSLSQAVQPFKGGDVVQIEYYRAGQKYTADLPLTKRPVPELPATPSALTEVMRANLETLSGELDALVAGVPEAAMSRRPEPNEWSANENIAHLIHTARNNQNWLFNLAGGDDSVLWMDNNELHLIYSTSVYPTSAELIAAFKREETALIAQVEALPAKVATIKPLMQYIGQNLTNLHFHTRRHYEQMRGALAAIQQPAV